MSCSNLDKNILTYIIKLNIAKLNIRLILKFYPFSFLT